MGNCFGKEESKNFGSQGRTLGDAPAGNQVTSASVPPKAKISSPSAGRTLGDPTELPTGDSPKAAAARAAEERSKAAQGRGRLGRQLDAQKGQTQANTLAQTAKDNMLARDADAATAERNYN